MRFLARDRNYIFGDTENAIAYVRLFARDTTARFCSLLLNAINPVCTVQLSLIEDGNCYRCWAVSGGQKEVWA